jgi:hypothetical protein
MIHCPFLFDYQDISDLLSPCRPIATAAMLSTSYPISQFVPAVLLHCNMEGSERFEPLIILKFEKSLWMKNVKN